MHIICIIAKDEVLILNADEENVVRACATLATYTRVSG